MIIKKMKLSTCFVKLLTFFPMEWGIYILVYFMHFFCAAVMEIFSNKCTCVCPLLQRETIAFILSNVKPRRVLHTSTFERAGKKATSWSRAKGVNVDK